MFVHMLDRVGYVGLERFAAYVPLKRWVSDDMPGISIRYCSHVALVLDVCRLYIIESGSVVVKCGSDEKVPFWDHLFQTCDQTAIRPLRRRGMWMTCCILPVTGTRCMETNEVFVEQWPLGSSCPASAARESGRESTYSSRCSVDLRSLNQYGPRPFKKST